MRRPITEARVRRIALAGDTLATLAGVVLAGIMMLTVVDVIGRYVFSRPVPGASELTEVAMAILIYAGLPVVSARNAHIAVDFGGAGRSERFKRTRDSIVHVLCALILAVVAWRLWVYAEQIRESKDVTEYLRMPQAPFAFVMSVFAGCAALLELARAVWPAPAGDAFGDPV